MDEKEFTETMDRIREDLNKVLHDGSVATFMSVGHIKSGVIHVLINGDEMFLLKNILFALSRIDVAFSRKLILAIAQQVGQIISCEMFDRNMDSGREGHG